MIYEAFEWNAVSWRMGLVLTDDERTAIAFKHLNPRLRTLVTIYRAAHTVLFGESGRPAEGDRRVGATTPAATGHSAPLARRDLELTGRVLLTPEEESALYSPRPSLSASTLASAGAPSSPAAVSPSSLRISPNSFSSSGATWKRGAL